MYFLKEEELPKLLYYYDSIVLPWAVERLGPAITSIRQLQPCVAIGVADKNDVVIGAIIYNNFIGHDLQMTIATDGTGRWCTRAILHDIFSYPFQQLGCARVSATTAKSNIMARRLLEKTGFRHEGTLRQGILGREDAVLYGMLKDECNWLKYAAADKKQSKPISAEPV